MHNTPPQGKSLPTLGPNCKPIGGATGLQLRHSSIYQYNTLTMALCESRLTEIGMMDVGAGITRRKGVAGKTPEGLVMEWTVINHDNISSFVAMKKYTYRASNLANSNRTMISDSGFYGILYIYHVRNSEVLCLGFIHQIAWRTFQIWDFRCRAE